MNPLNSRIVNELPQARESRLAVYGPTALILFVSNLIVWYGLYFGSDVLGQNPRSGQLVQRPIHAASNWDGNWYRGIAKDGYAYDPSKASNVAFFPGYPGLAWLLRQLTGLSIAAALPLVSLLAFTGALFVFQWYSQAENIGANDTEAQWCRIAMCAWPTGLFLRIGYSESLFLLLLLLAMLGMRRQWPSWVVAIIVGAATGVRSVGVALLLPLLWDWWRNSTSWKRLSIKLLALGPVACWGLFGYIIYLNNAFKEPLAFVKTQRFWEIRTGVGGWRNILNLVTLEPIRSVYIRNSGAAWNRREIITNPLFSFEFFNPIYFVFCVIVVAYGARKKWLTIPEVLLSAGLLGIPYVMQGHRMAMQGHGRFVCVVFPMFIVLGRLLARSPTSVRLCVVVLMGIQLFQWSAMFGVWHRVF